MNQSRIEGRPEVLFEDEHILIVCKEPEELTVPGRGPDKEFCLMIRAMEYYGSLFNVHRLDQPTSGLVIIARTKEMQRQLSILFQEKQIYKEYVALVEGQVSEKRGEISLPMRGDPDNRPYQIIDAVNGKFALTRWRVLGYEENMTRVELIPETGRTHQLRLHMKSLGHPIAGDRLYNPAVPDDLMGELKLHARCLRFIHPFTKETVTVISEPRF